MTYKVEDWKTHFEILENECWQWKGAPRSGYSIVTIAGKRMRAHIVFYEKKFGKVPVGLELDHKCKNKLCVNPDHLEPVTHAINMQRSSNSKFNQEDVAKVREMRAEGKTLFQIGQYFGVTKTTIGNIVNGYSFKQEKLDTEAVLPTT